MTIVVSVFIENPKHLLNGKKFASRFHEFHIRTLLLTTTQNRAKVQDLEYKGQVSKGEYQQTESLKSIIPVLISNNITMVFSESLVDNNQDAIAFSVIDYSQEMVYCLGQRFSFKQFTELIAHLVRQRSCVSAGVKFENEFYAFCGETPSNSFSFQVPQSNNMSLYEHHPLVHLSWPFTSSDVMVNKWKHLTQRLRLTDKLTDNPQVYVVANASTVIPKVNGIYFCMEPYGERLYKSYLDQLPPQNMIFMGTHDRHLNNAEWHLSSTLADLKRMKIKKVHDRVLSVCVTSKDFDPGHKYRLGLIHYMDKLGDKLPFQLHIYGRCQSQNFINYRGELPDQEKDRALFDYKYHLNVENQYIPNYITEKLYDTLCAETLMFYYGCPNWRDFFDSDCLVELNGDGRYEADVELITRTIMNDEWSKRLPSIKKNKQRILHEYSFEPRVMSILQVVRTNVYVPNEEIRAEMLKEGFKSVHVAQGVLRIVDAFHKCLQERTPMLLFNQTDVKKCRLVFDKMCFAVARDHNLEMLKLSQGDDMFLMPRGIEKAYQNVMAKRPSLLDGLKVTEVAV